MHHPVLAFDNIETLEETQIPMPHSKASPTSMEATSNRQLASVGRLNASSCTKRLSQEIWTFADRPKLLAVEVVSYDCSGISFAPYGDYWRQLRKICTLDLLSTKRVQSFRTLREEEAHNLFESIYSSKGLPINLTEKIFAFTNDVTCMAAFGMKCKDQAELMSVIRGSIELAGGFNVPDIFPSIRFLHSISGMKPALEKVHLRVDKLLDEIITQHQLRREKAKASSHDKLSKEDLVDVLLRIQESGGLEFPITNNNIKAVLLDIFTAGTETSSSTLEWAMAEMMKKPRVMEKAQAEVRQLLERKGEISETDIQELHYLKAVIRETLRLHPPVPLLLPREAILKCNS